MRSVGEQLSTKCPLLQVIFTITIILFVRVKEAQKRQRNCSNTKHRIYFGRSPWRGSPARELEFTAAFRLGIDIGEWSREEILLGWKILPEWSQPAIGEDRGDKW
jgi:hypothetical protein